MGEDLSVGDMGVTDPFGLAVDLPTPDLHSADGMDATLAGPGGLGASLAEVGLAASAATIQVSDGVGASFSGSLDVPAFSSEGLGGLPPLEAPGASVGPEAFSSESIPAGSPAAFSSAGVASFSDAPSASEGLPGGISGLPGIEPPAPTPSPFAGVATAPEEFMDLQLALSPPEPSQEGFAGISDAPMSGSVGPLGVEGGGQYAGLSTSMAQSISEKAWGPSGGSSRGGSSGAGVSGHSIRIENLHLPATSPNEMVDGLLAASSDLTNADLSGLAA